MRTKEVTGTQRAGYLRRRPLATFLGISERHLAELVRRRIIPVIRLGHRCCLFDPDRVREALNKFEQREIGRTD